MLFFRDYYLSYLTDSAAEIRIFLSLVSSRTVLEDEQLKAKFSESVEVLRALQ
jgi:hypothetical protein